jgi:hypothetical protein
LSLGLYDGKEKRTAGKIEKTVVEKEFCDE